MQERTIRAEMLLGSEAMEKLRGSHVAVFGLGGVGSWCAEALARAGVGALDLIDSDTVAPSNLNRQIIALHSTIGMYKVDAAAARVRDINPDCAVTPHRCFFLPETEGQFDFTRYDYVVDAIDTVTGKLALIEKARAAGTPIICAMGAGNKLHPERFEIADIYETSVCPLARVMRKECKKRGIEHLKVVYSKEPPVTPDPELETAARAETPDRRDIPGSVSFTPSAAGLILAGEVVRDLLRAGAAGKTAKEQETL
jgi:tRNA A37 threonylcarbamoyladenosine dehydratase